MESLDRLYERLSRRNFDDIVLQQVSGAVSQVRFSNNRVDLESNWVEETIEVFAARGKKIIAYEINDLSRLDSAVEFLTGTVDRMPENPSYEGINTVKTDQGNWNSKARESDLNDYALAMIGSAVDNGAQKCAGILYRKTNTTSLITPYNSLSVTTSGHEAVIRSFVGESTGQEALHFGPDTTFSDRVLEKMGKESAQTASRKVPRRVGDAGKIDVILSPYVIGSLLSYSAQYFSAESVIAGLSFLEGKIGKDVSSRAVSLLDDPTDRRGIAFVPFDMEGTITRRNVLIEKGILKTYVHSCSTAKRFNTHTTGNAGILNPMPWQLKLMPGTGKVDSMISESRNALLILNTWYTRFQDDRNGVFSTVPRDGIFHVIDGEIVESWSGVRISDSIPNILKSITQTSRDTKWVKWWLEISPSEMPFASLENINISRSF